MDLETKLLHRNPEYTIFTGPMYAGKTSLLIMELEKLKYQHRKVKVFKPSVDVRYSDDHIVTHGGLRWVATPVVEAADIIQTLEQLPDDEQIDVVAVDEAFMIKGVGDVLNFLFINGISVVVSTLDISSSGKAFKEVEKMFPYATNIVKCTAVCTICSQQARYTYRKVDIKEEVLIGGAELYEPRCYTHAPTINKRDA